MSDERKKISVIVPVSLLDQVKEKSDFNITDSVIKGLELLVNNIESDRNNIKSDGYIIKNSTGIDVLNIENAGLKEQIKTLNENQQARIEDLKVQINSLHEQMKVKDNQLNTRDAEIQQLTQNIQGQALTIHNLTQEKKLLADNTKKPWWRFW